MFFEFLAAVISLDVNWLAGLLFSNLHYLFVFGAIGFFFWGNSVKKMAVIAVMFPILMWTWVDFEILSGWIWAVPAFMAIYYISKIAVLTWAEDTPQLKSKLVIISEIQALALIAIFNLFIV